MSSEPVITARGLTKRYRFHNHPLEGLLARLTGNRVGHDKGFLALDNVTFEVHRGETVGIIGRNGSGKSTLLQLICGIRTATLGTVSTRGRVSALLELGSGFHPEFTGRENVFLQGAIMGISRVEMQARFDAIAEFAGIGDFIEHAVKTYSSGMFLRLAFATAINVDPDILIVDEALAVGDTGFQARCHAAFNALRSGGRTIVFVTHDLNQVVTHCDRAILLDRSRLVATGSPKYVVDCYRHRLGEADGAHQYVTHRKTGDWTGLFNLNGLETRYGNRAHEITEAGIFTTANRPTQTLHHGEICSIRIRLTHRRKPSRSFVSFVIKDIKGQPLMGSTSEWESAPPPATPLDDGSEAVFQFPMLLNSGSYLLSVGIQSRTALGEIVANDHRTDYLIFEVIGHDRHGIFCAPLECQWT
jgi:ABC-type polysaccharide/polyol phosphate transport system ATPase subunit